MAHSPARAILVTMANLEKDEYRELRRALERLFQQLFQATDALDRLSTSMRESFGTYRKHGAPFGRSRTAVRIWMTYRQYTTPN